jgi:hypothetical protein
MGRMRNWLRTLCPALLLLACNGAEPTTAIDTDRFVETIVELRHAAAETRGDTAAYEARKQQILRERQLSEDELRDYVAQRGRDAEHMAEVWSEINRRLSDRFLEPTLH